MDERNIPPVKAPVNSRQQQQAENPDDPDFVSVPFSEAQYPENNIETDPIQAQHKQGANAQIVLPERADPTASPAPSRSPSPEEFLVGHPAATTVEDQGNQENLENQEQEQEQEQTISNQVNMEPLSVNGINGRDSSISGGFISPYPESLGPEISENLEENGKVRKIEMEGITPEPLGQLDLEELKERVDRLKLEVDLYKGLIQRFWSGSTEAEDQICSLLGLPNRNISALIRQMISTSPTCITTPVPSSSFRTTMQGFQRPQMSPAQLTYLHARKEYLERKLSQHQDMINQFYGRPKTPKRPMTGTPALHGMGIGNARTLFEMYRQQNPTAPSIPAKSYAVDLHLGPFMATPPPGPSSHGRKSRQNSFVEFQAAPISMENVPPVPKSFDIITKPLRPKSATVVETKSANKLYATIDVNEMFDPYSDTERKQQGLALSNRLRRVKSAKPTIRQSSALEKTLGVQNPDPRLVELSPERGPTLAAALTALPLQSPQATKPGANSVRSPGATPRKENATDNSRNQELQVGMVQGQPMGKPISVPSDHIEKSTLSTGMLGIGLGGSGSLGTVGILRPKSAVHSFSGATSSLAGSISSNALSLGSRVQARRGLSVKFSDSVEVGAPSSYQVPIRLPMKLTSENEVGALGLEGLSSEEPSPRQLQQMHVLQQRLGIDEQGHI